MFTLTSSAQSRARLACRTTVARDGIGKGMRQARHAHAVDIGGELLEQAGTGRVSKASIIAADVTTAAILMMTI